MNPQMQQLPMQPQEVLNVVDILYEAAGLQPDATEDQLAKRLGPNAATRVHQFAEAMRFLADESPESSDGVVPGSDNYLSMSDSDTDVRVPDIDVSKKRKASLPDDSLVARPKVQKAYKSETEIALSRILDLGKVAKVAHPEIEPSAPYSGPPIITMTGFGELGRWGNQLLQYMFLKAYSSRTGAEVQVPDWVGATLFGLDDEPVQRRFPAAVENPGMKANSTFTDDFIDYIRASNKGREVPEIGPDVLETADLDQVDFWGWFQWPTKHYKPFETLIRDTFTPIPSLRAHFDKVIEKNLRGDGKRTVVGLHLRLGDYKNIAASSFGYCAPTSWYLEWLEEIWPTLENPVLFVASDEIDTVLRDFAAYKPVTADMISATLPNSFKGSGAGFFGDWYTLTQCDVVAISNSTFSFTACMLNQRGPRARFYRAHYANKMVPFDPWNADPIIHRETGASSFAAIGSTLKLLYDTQGTRGVMKNVFYELPYYGLRSVVMRTVLRARANGNSKNNNAVAAS